MHILINYLSISDCATVMIAHFSEMYHTACLFLPHSEHLVMSARPKLPWLSKICLQRYEVTGGIIGAAQLSNESRQSPRDKFKVRSGEEIL